MGDPGHWARWSDTGTQADSHFRDTGALWGPDCRDPDTRSERDRAPASWPHVVASDSLGHRHLHEHLQRGVLFPGGQA